MKFISVNQHSPAVDFQQALLQGIAPDGGLYVPESIPVLSDGILNQLTSQNLHQLAIEIASQYITEIPKTDLEKIIKKALNFPIPLITLEDNLFLLELFHGPTLAFKDVGARFMAQVLSYFLTREKQQLAIITATSGDTGSAVAHGFFNVPGIKVFILYPANKITALQEQQMVTLGDNIYPVAVNGTFDDCQRMIKATLGDQILNKNHLITTANSINLGRLIPQIIYHAWAVSQLLQKNIAHNSLPLLVVPSGNFGNIVAAVYAKRMGIPIGHFVAATNANDVVPNYFASGQFNPRPSVTTISNAMDVGNPSNMARLQYLYENNLKKLQQDMTAIAISDDETIKEIQRVYHEKNKIIDPHTAVGVAAARKTQQANIPTIVAATAHPAKFPEVIKRALGFDMPLPPELSSLLNKSKQNHHIISNDYSTWRELFAAIY